MAYKDIFSNFPIPYDILYKLNFHRLSYSHKMRVNILLNSVPPKYFVKDRDYYQDLLQTAILYAVLYSNDSFIDVVNFLREVRALHSAYKSLYLPEGVSIINPEKPQLYYKNATTIRKINIKLHPHFSEVLSLEFGNQRQAFVRALIQAYKLLRLPLRKSNKRWKGLTYMSVSLDLPTYFELCSLLSEHKFDNFAKLLFAIQLSLLELRGLLLSKLEEYDESL